MGHDVCLLEADRFPRAHVGESLAPGIVSLLDYLGLRQRIEAAGFLRPEAAIVRWGGTLRRLHFSAGSFGLQVDRGRFDRHLLDAAREAGVRVLQPARARRPLLVGGRWLVPFDYGGEARRVEATFLVDASGRRSALGGRRVRSSPPTLAVYAYWRGLSFAGAETRVEAGADEWFWGAPLPDGTFNATAFVAPSRCRAAARGGGLEAFYRSLLADSVLLRGCLGGELVSRVEACDASDCVADAPATSRSIKVGEANFTIDPLSSQGVQAAMTSAVHASVVAHTLLVCPDNTQAALSFYNERQAETVAYHRRAAAGYYSEQRSVSPQKFWSDRAAPEPETLSTRLPAARPTLGRNPVGENCHFAPSKEVIWGETPCVVGNTIRPVTTLSHPTLARPVAFVRDVEAAPLLRAVGSGATLAEILERWSASLSRDDGLDVLCWMRAAGLLVPIQD